MDVCPKNAITMSADEKGFLYPLVNTDECVHCGLCDKNCAMANEKDISDNVRGYYALQHKDPLVVANSSSGGAFTAISDIVLKAGGVVCGATLDPNNFKVSHICASTEQDRNQMRGSKYVQSETIGIFMTIKNQLKEGKTVLFSGTPCQCAELDKFIGDRPGNLVIVDLFCHGAPSNQLLIDHIKYWEKKTSKKAIVYNYRSKKYGYAHTHEIAFDDGSKNTSIDLKRLLKLYTLSMRDSCYECPYASHHRYGDITIADLWEAPKVAGLYDSKGTSLVLVNTEKGEKLLKKIENDCLIKPVDISILKPGALNKAVSKTPRVDVFWQDYFEHGYEYVLNKYAPRTAKSNCYQALLRCIHIIGLDRMYAKMKG